MDFIGNAYLAAFLLGVVHALEVDHMVAVSVFAGLKPRWRAAALYGACWGLGHAAVVVLVGGALAWSGLQVSTAVTHWGEALVGFALIALGLWAFRTGYRLHVHPPAEHDLSPNSRHGHLHAHGGEPSHVHSHSHSPQHHHQHLPTAMGALHGLAGSAPVLALVPITMMAQVSQALIYLLVFSVGTTLSMTTYALLATAAMEGLGLTRVRLQLLTAFIASLTILVGCWWIINALSYF